MINKLQLKYRKTPSNRKRINTDNLQDNSNPKCFIIHHLGEPRVSPLHIERMKKMNKKEKRC